MEHPLVIQIRPDGEVTVVYHPDKQRVEVDVVTQALGTAREERRFGHVVPRSLILRTAFRILRALFGGAGRIADWTRAWHCWWVIVDANTGKRWPGEHYPHVAAVRAEVDYILVTRRDHDSNA